MDVDDNGSGYAIGERKPRTPKSGLNGEKVAKGEERLIEGQDDTNGGWRSKYARITRLLWESMFSTHFRKDISKEVTAPPPPSCFRYPSPASFTSLLIEQGIPLGHRPPNITPAHKGED